MRVATEEEFQALQARLKPHSAGVGKASSGNVQPAPPKRKRAASVKPLVAQFVEREAKDGELVFVLPLPPIESSPNWRGYWAVKAMAVKTYRQQCAALMSESGKAFTGRVIVDLEFYYCRVQGDKKSCYSKDEDNARASMKAAQDALKDAGIIPGDGKKFVQMGKTTLYTRAEEHQGFTCVVMTIREAAQ